ncbi:MAG: hypothetical protein RL708_1372 [Bacteroidota bacterium]|jgi:hypothetical protein
MNNQDFIKGKQFEDYLEKVIFPKTDYDLVEKTHTHEQNFNRYVESSQAPDFKFRDKKTKVEFYVEAKYRSRFDFNDKIQLIDLDQYKRYKKFQKPGCPIFIAVGYEGIASNPNGISIIPLEEIDYKELFKSVVKKYSINPNQKIQFSDLKNIIESESEKTDSKSNFEKDSIPKTESNSNKIKNSKTLMLIAISIVILCFCFYKLFYTSPSKKIKEQITEYYSAVDNRDINALDMYLAKNVENWFNKRNISSDEIKKASLEYYKIIESSETEILWDTYKFEELNNGDFSCSYKAIYRVKFNKSNKRKSFNLILHTIWNNDYKLKSIFEEQL